MQFCTTSQICSLYLFSGGELGGGDESKKIQQRPALCARTPKYLLRTAGIREASGHFSNTGVPGKDICTLHPRVSPLFISKHVCLLFAYHHFFLCNLFSLSLSVISFNRTLRATTCTWLLRGFRFRFRRMLLTARPAAAWENSACRPPAISGLSPTWTSPHLT